MSSEAYKIHRSTPKTSSVSDLSAKERGIGEPLPPIERDKAFKAGGWVSSAAQQTVDLDAFVGKYPLSDDFSAYAQSKVAIIMWNHYLARHKTDNSPAYIAVNPASLLGSKMVKEGFGVAGKDLSIGVDIFIQLALDSAFEKVTGEYFDNDIGRFNDPHPDALDDAKCASLIALMDELISR